MNNENTKQEVKDELLLVLRGMADSLADISTTLVSIKDDGVMLNNPVTEAFTSAISSGGLDSVLGTFASGAQSTADVKDVLDALKDPSGAAGDMNMDSAQSLIDSLKDAKERLSAISTAIGSAEASSSD